MSGTFSKPRLIKVIFMEMIIIWAVALGIFIVLELMTAGLVTVWFAVGAAASLVSAFLGTKLWFQILLFIVVSVVTLVLTRPLVKKYVNGKRVPTNADMNIGKEARVIEEINGLEGTGLVNLGGTIWSAISMGDDIINVGTIVTVKQIKGVKLIVAPVPSHSEV